MTFLLKELESSHLFIGESMLRSIPSVSQCLQNLVTLVLYNCESLETIADVGRLVSLEILIFHGCSLGEVPVELRGLKRLKLLDISACWNLKRIAPGVISSLVALEELKMVGSFKKWEADIEGKERECRYKELEALTNLRCLDIEVLDSVLAGVPLCLSPKLVKFNVVFGEYNSPTPTKIYDKMLHLEANKGFGEYGSWGDLSIDTFVMRTEYLNASHYSLNANMSLADAGNTRWLTLSSFKNMKNVTALVDSRSGAALFPLLEYLCLDRMYCLEEIWDGPIPANSFNNLKELTLYELTGLKQLWRSPYHHNNVVPIFTNLSSIYISNCNVLGHVFSSANAKDCHLQLERIEIGYCDLMEHVVVFQNVADLEISTIFPKLKTLSIMRLPKLTSICKGIGSIEFPLLTQLKIENCSDMNCLVSTEDHNNLEAGHYHDLDSIHLFCEPKVSFCNLKELTIEGSFTKNAWCYKVPIGFFHGLERLTIMNCSNIKSLFSSSVAENLVNLQSMTIGECPKMVKLIEDTSDGSMKLLFPRLLSLWLQDLPELESFCEWRCAVELPSLKVLQISGCSNLRRFTAGSIIAPALLDIHISGYCFTSVKDINAGVQQYFAKAQEEERKLKEYR